MESAAISRDIASTFQALGLLLVFVSALFAIRYPEAITLVQGEVPGSDRPRERARMKNEIRSFLKGKWLPLAAINGVSIYPFLPLAIRVCVSSRVHLWDFDVERTSFIVVFALLLGAFVWVVVTGIMLWRKLTNYG